MIVDRIVQLKDDAPKFGAILEDHRHMFTLNLNIGIAFIKRQSLIRGATSHPSPLLHSNLHLTLPKGTVMRFVKSHSIIIFFWWMK